VWVLVQEGCVSLGGVRILWDDRLWLFVGILWRVGGCSLNFYFYG